MLEWIGLLFCVVLITEIGASPDGNIAEKMFLIFLILVIGYSCFGDKLSKENS